MTWLPQNNSLLCAGNSTLPQCDPAALAFLTFLVQYFGQSYDSRFTDSKVSNEQDQREYDFIIIGAGSAGCVLANRLSEIEDWKILLLEAGDEEPLVTDVPATARPAILKSNIDYNYQTQPEPIACASNDDHTCTWPRGKTMGGSSSINGMVYIRGSRQDFDEWQNLGNPGWSYEDVLPYFKKAEDMRIGKIVAENPENYGVGGYLTVDFFPYVNKLTQLFLKAWKELGVEEVDNNSGDGKFGASKAQRTTINGARQSNNGAYIRPIRGRRKNLTIRVKAQVTKILIDRKSKTAYGVEYETENKMKKRVFARKEVIVSAGAIESPKLLMLSGIGPADELREAQIPLIKELDVGKNLQDHPSISGMSFDMNAEQSVLGSYEQVQNDFTYWLSTHEGPASGAGVFDMANFLRTKYETTPGVPDIQPGITASLLDKPYISRAYYNQGAIGFNVLKPKSRGEIKLNKTDPIYSPPLIYANYFTDEYDVKVGIAGLKMVRKIFDTEAFKKAGFVEKRKPGCDSYEYNTDEYWYCILRRYTATGYHPVGTCKMGSKNDSTAVVDSKLRVYGIKNLRVIDGSIMPDVTRGNTHAPIVMIAEKGSDMIKKSWL